MFCMNCGTKLDNGQKFCPSCGTKCDNSKMSAPSETGVEDIETSASFIKRAYTILCGVSMSLVCFWKAIDSNSDFESFIPAIIFAEISLVVLALYVIFVNERYKYNSAKLVIIWAILTIFMIIFLMYNIENPEATSIMSIFFAILCFVVGFALKKALAEMTSSQYSEKPNFLSTSSGETFIKTVICENCGESNNISSYHCISCGHKLQ